MSGMDSLKNKLNKVLGAGVVAVGVLTASGCDVLPSDPSAQYDQNIVNPEKVKNMNLARTRLMKSVNWRDVAYSLAKERDSDLHKYPYLIPDILRLLGSEEWTEQSARIFVTLFSSPHTPRNLISEFYGKLEKDQRFWEMLERAYKIEAPQGRFGDFLIDVCKEGWIGMFNYKMRWGEAKAVQVTGSETKKAIQSLLTNVSPSYIRDVSLRLLDVASIPTGYKTHYAEAIFDAFITYQRTPNAPENVSQEELRKAIFAYAKVDPSIIVRKKVRDFAFEKSSGDLGWEQVLASDVAVRDIGGISDMFYVTQDEKVMRWCLDGIIKVYPPLVELMKSRVRERAGDVVDAARSARLKVVEEYAQKGQSLSKVFIGLTALSRMRGYLPGDIVRPADMRYVPHLHLSDFPKVDEWVSRLSISKMEDNERHFFSDDEAWFKDFGSEEKSLVEIHGSGDLYRRELRNTQREHGNPLAFAAFVRAVVDVLDREGIDPKAEGFQGKVKEAINLVLRTIKEHHDVNLSQRPLSFTFNGEYLFDESNRTFFNDQVRELLNSRWKKGHGVQIISPYEEGVVPEELSSPIDPAKHHVTHQSLVNQRKRIFQSLGSNSGWLYVLSGHGGQKGDLSLYGKGGSGDTVLYPKHVAQVLVRRAEGAEVPVLFVSSCSAGSNLAAVYKFIDDPSLRNVAGAENKHVTLPIGIGVSIEGQLSHADDTNLLYAVIGRAPTVGNLLYNAFDLPENPFNLTSERFSNPVFFFPVSPLVQPDGKTQEAPPVPYIRLGMGDTSTQSTATA